MRRQLYASLKVKVIVWPYMAKLEKHGPEGSFVKVNFEGTCWRTKVRTFEDLSHSYYRVAKYSEISELLRNLALIPSIPTESRIFQILREMTKYLTNFHYFLSNPLTWPWPWLLFSILVAPVAMNGALMIMYSIFGHYLSHRRRNKLLSVR